LGAVIKFLGLIIAYWYCYFFFWGKLGKTPKRKNKAETDTASVDRLIRVQMTFLAAAKKLNQKTFENPGRGASPAKKQDCAVGDCRLAPIQ